VISLNCLWIDQYTGISSHGIPCREVPKRGKNLMT
jgi:hypothetical protein